MNKKELVGIVKFFSNEEHLDSLIGGTFYCNTPEFYRRSNFEGISDKNESCLFSYRADRRDEDVYLEINSIEIKGIKNFTAYNPGIKDAWLHCWMSLKIPSNYKELDILNKDVHRLKSEFGYNYSFISYDKIPLFLKTLESLTSHRVLAGEIAYSDKPTNCSPTCKALSYSYQREFRFLLGECSAQHIKPLILKCEKGFKQYIEKNPEIKFKGEGQEDLFFEISTDSHL